MHSFVHASTAQLLELKTISSRIPREALSETLPAKVLEPSDARRACEFGTKDGVCSAVLGPGVVRHRAWDRKQHFLGAHPSKSYAFCACCSNSAGSRPAWPTTHDRTAALMSVKMQPPSTESICRTAAPHAATVRLQTRSPRQRQCQSFHGRLQLQQTPIVTCRGDWALPPLVEALLRGDCSSSNALRGGHHKGSGIAGASHPEKAQMLKLSEQKYRKRPSL